MSPQLLAVGVLTVSMACSAGPRSAVYGVEAEALVLSYSLLRTVGATQGMVAEEYTHASGKLSLHLLGHPLVWTLRVGQPGAYAFWLRARSGYSKDRFYTAKGGARYAVTIGEAAFALHVRKDTLDYVGDGENFVWFSTEPVQLAAGDVHLTVTSGWRWAHVDCMALTTDADFQPGRSCPGSVEAPFPLEVWTDSPYVPVTPTMAPPAEAGEAGIALDAVRNSTAYAALYVHNPGESVRHLRTAPPELIAPGGSTWPPTSMHLKQVAFRGIRPGLAAGDALPRLNRHGTFDVAPGHTRAFWLLLATPEDLASGEYRGSWSLQDQASLTSVSVPVTVRVSKVTLPRGTPLVVFNWWGYGDAPRAWWEDAIAHGVNAFKLQVSREVQYCFDSEGSLIGDMGFSRLGLFVEYAKRGDGYLLLEWYLHAPTYVGLRCNVPGAASGPELAYMSAAWRRAFRTLVVRTTDYLVSQGIPEDHVLQYTYDEYLGDKFVETAKLIRSWGPRFRLFSDRGADLATYRRVAPWVDVWCPPFHTLGRMAKDGRLQFMRETGRPVWAYDCGHMQRAESPYTKYRLKFWHAWRHELDGCTYWKHSGDNVGTAYRPVIGDAPVTSRRWEAWYSGLQDYQVLALVRRFVDAATPAAEEARQTLRSAVDEVLTKPDELGLADQWRGRLVRLLEQMP